jgi:hypothetical protein
MTMGTFESHNLVGIPPHCPTHLMHGVVMPPAQRDEVGEIRLPTKHPRHNVVYLREVHEPTTREPTTFVSTRDLDALRHGRTSAYPFLIEN